MLFETAAEMYMADRSKRLRATTLEGHESAIRKHIDPGVHIRTSPLGPGQTLHINGSEWQTYFLFGSSSVCAVIEHRGADEPNVSKLSGSNMTVKKGADASIDVSVTGLNGTITVFSFRDFTLTRG